MTQETTIETTGVEANAPDGSEDSSDDSHAERVDSEIVSDDAVDEEPADETPELTKDDLFHVLQNDRRRNVIRYICGREESSFEMRDIAEQVAAWEHDTTLRALTSDERQRVYIALYQSHLPKLDDAGLIDYNQKRGFVDQRPLIERARMHIDGLEQTDDGPEHDDGGDEVASADGTDEEPTGPDWSRVTTATAGVGLLLTVVIALGLLTAPLAGVAVAGGVSAVTGAASLADRLDD